MLTYSSYGARNRHLGGPTTDAGETPSPLEKLLLKQEKTPSDHKLRGRTCWNLHLLHGNRTNSGHGFPSGARNGRRAAPSRPRRSAPSLSDRPGLELFPRNRAVGQVTLRDVSRNRPRT